MGVRRYFIDRFGGLTKVISYPEKKALYNHLMHIYVSSRSLGCREISWRPWASYQIRKSVGCACARNAGNVLPRLRMQRKTRVSDPGTHHCTCVTHVPWCMSGLFPAVAGKTFPAFPAHAHPQFGKRSIGGCNLAMRHLDTLWCCYWIHYVFYILSNIMEAMQLLQARLR